MGFLLAIAIGLMFDKIANTKLATGNYSFKQTVLGYGFFGGGVLLALSVWYIANVLMSDNTYYLTNTLDAAELIAILLSVYSYCVILGIWKASKDVSFFAKILSRYLSLFFVGFILAAIKFTWIHFLIIGLVVFAKKNNIFSRHFSNKVTNNS